ncbi:hypothetical protein LCGC14_1709920 [marine sediment metagenome]|uniref:Uncharacterized protein n=1 Tax=marine sediment metagenome TaxID=412755 RepID=A0A0F9KFL2_9ZZZZ
MALDIRYEKHLCERLLEISRYMYALEASPSLPRASEVMATKKDASPEEIRDQIQENLDFISVTMKYLVFEREALKREKAELKKEKQ